MSFANWPSRHLPWRRIGHSAAGPRITPGNRLSSLVCVIPRSFCGSFGENFDSATPRSLKVLVSGAGRAKNVGVGVGTTLWHIANSSPRHPRKRP